MEATRGWTEKKPWEIASGEFRYGETVGNRGWTERKPSEIAWGESSGGKECYGYEERPEGGRGGTVGNGLERARVGRSDTGWTEGKPCEIAWGELRWEGWTEGKL